MTSRLLLALLAFLTGLSVQIAPAQARAGGVSAIGASVAVVGTQRLVQRVQSDGVAQVARPRMPRDCMVVMLATSRNCTPPVMLGIDRAHE